MSDPNDYRLELREGEPPESLEQAIQLTVGAASVCWDKDGVFESERALQISNALRDYIVAQQPWLGYATNTQLQEELRVRTELGHTDPDYSTVGTP